MNEYIGYVVVGLCTGLGSALGNYIAIHGLVGHLKKIVNGKVK